MARRLPDLPEKIGKYEILTSIGAGGMANVYLGRQTGLAGFEKTVVIKAIHRHLAKETKFVEMFLDEARIAAQINHPNVAQVYDLGAEDDTYFIVMEYVPGEPLGSVIVTGIEQKRPISPNYAARLVAWAAEGLHAAHELHDLAGEHLEVIHRDVSPANILALYQGGAKVVDFGIAKARGRLTKTETEGLKGKLSYLSPEQLDNKPIDRRSDIFALGIVLWELLALKRLFHHEHPAAAIKAILIDPIDPPSSARREVPAALDEITMRALQRNPADRYQTAQEMQLALEICGLPGTVDLANYMGQLFAARIERRQMLLKRLATGGRLDSQELEAVAQDFQQDESGSLSLPPVNPLWRASLEERREPLRRPTGSQPPPPPADAFDAGGDDLDIDIDVHEQEESREAPRPAPIEIDFEALGEEAALVAEKLKKASGSGAGSGEDGAGGAGSKARTSEGESGGEGSEGEDPTPEKKSRRWPWFVLGFILVLLAAGVVAWKLGYLDPLLEKLPIDLLPKAPSE